MTDYVVVTGGNRGIGLGIAKQLMTSTSHVIVVSRSAKSEDGSLEALCKQCNGTLTFVSIDLNDVGHLADTFRESVLSLIDEQQARSVTAILNAGLAFTVRCGEQESDKIVSLMNVNAIAPLLMTEQLVRLMQAWPLDKRILCVGSGAASKPYHGWTSYGASKAALAHMCRIVHVEQQDQAHPIRICCYGPGVVETAMQQAVRASSETLPTVKILQGMKNENKVFTPDFAGELAVGYLKSDAFGKEKATEDAYIVLAAKNEKKSE